MPGAGQLLPMGRFSGIVRLSVKQLRHYDDLGLLTPALVDGSSGFRYYSLSQVRDAERIRLLRQLEMPLATIRAVLNERDPDRLKVLLADYRERLETRIEAQRQAVAALELLSLNQAWLSASVELRELPAQSILTHRSQVNLNAIGKTSSQVFHSLYTFIGRSGGRAAGPPFTIFHDNEFNETSMDVEFGVPIQEPLTPLENWTARQLPAGRAAVLVHSGSYTEIASSHAALVAWTLEHGHVTGGPVREVYLVAPDRTDQPEALRTEIVVPLES
jgi:DNA-binding transcriptional MerR regulator